MNSVFFRVAAFVVVTTVATTALVLAGFSDERHDVAPAQARSSQVPNDR